MNNNFPSLSPLQLKSCFFTAINIRANPNGKPTGITNSQQEIGYLPVSGQPNHWSLQLAVKLSSSDPNNPFIYDAEIHAMGVVEVSESLAVEKREPLAVINGLSILYGACREMLINITARSLYGPCSIPSLNFAQVVREAQEQLMAQQKAQAAQSIEKAAAPAALK